MQVEAHKSDISCQMDNIDQAIAIKLYHTDKSDFKCLKMKDGSVYYGQLIEILPNDKRPVGLEPGIKPPGFNMHRATPQVLSVESSLQHLSEEPEDAAQKQAELILEAKEPWIVYDKPSVPEELLEHIIRVRHGFGI